MVDVLSGFDYGYRMRCVCGATIWLSAQQYWDQSLGDPTVCERCGETTHFGPYTALLRDEDDRALADEMVGRLAWYHTSTYPDWPSSSFAADATRFLDEHPMRDAVALDDLAEYSLTKALHVGTYECAIENMLRRMDTQTQVGVPFYLHRVQLCVAAGEVNEGYRDENYDSVSQVLLKTLEAENLWALRYLNVQESGGSLSLAIDPAVIVSVQSIALPVPALAPDPDPEHLQTLRTLDHAEAEEDAARSAQFSSWFKEITGKSDRALGRSSARQRPPRYRPSNTGVEFLCERYLAGVGLPVGDALGQGLANWFDSAGSADGAQDFYRQFLAHAALLTRPEAVVAAVKKAPVCASRDIDVVRERRALRHRVP
ncbi:hypothetical protein [Nocardia carnea]|uniref:hypothetical protein n=1 Tax=Nocardia carnea TaxID=37328 RepID=UPI0012DE43F2|nr:hypothetical protein [Nocardia carnea]